MSYVECTCVPSIDYRTKIKNLILVILNGRDISLFIWIVAEAWIEYILRILKNFAHLR